MYPSVKFRLVEKAVKHFLRNCSRKDKATAQRCLTATLPRELANFLAVVQYPHAEERTTGPNAWADPKPHDDLTKWGRLNALRANREPNTSNSEFLSWMDSVQRQTL